MGTYSPNRHRKVREDVSRSSPLPRPRSTKPTRPRRLQRKLPSVLTTFANQVLDFQAAEGVAFAQFLYAIDCFADRTKVLRRRLPRLSGQHFFDIRCNGETKSARLLSQLFRNVHGNLHGGILSSSAGRRNAAEAIWVAYGRLLIIQTLFHKLFEYSSSSKSRVSRHFLKMPPSIRIPSRYLLTVGNYSATMPHDERASTAPSLQGPPSVYPDPVAEEGRSCCCASPALVS